MGKLDGKRIVITGSTRSLGRQFALACARQGASVVINGTNAGLLDEVAAEIAKLGAPVEQVCGSVAESATCSSLVERCVSAFGGIDVLVNNAGIVRDKTLLKMSDEDFDEVIAVDLRGPFLCTRQAALAMKEQGHGHIIHITSGSGLVGNFGQTNYAAAKAGMIGFSRALAREVGSRDITVNTIAPGFIETDMTRAMTGDQRQALAEQIPLGRLGQPADIARAVVFLASAAGSYITGETLNVNGGMYMA